LRQGDDGAASLHAVFSELARRKARGKIVLALDATIDSFAIPK
jgi:hypothetical protein